MPGPMELILLLLVVALIFGAKKLPELGKGLGQGIREFKSETRDPAPPVGATAPLSDVTVGDVTVSGGQVTDVQARPLDAEPVTAPGAAAPERDHRA